MNKMKKMYVIWGMLVLGLFTILTVFGFTYKNKTQKYKELEEKLVQAEKKYIDAKFLYPDQNESLKTDASVLIENNFLDSLEINGEICTGYALISKKTSVFEYKGFIKCNNYQTKGYQN